MSALAEARAVHGEVVRHGAVAHVTVGDGSLRNALGVDGWDRLRRTAEELTGLPDLMAVVLRGAGGTFCAGFRLDGWLDADSDSVDASFAAMEAALQAVERIDVPTVAVVEGVAAGAGCQLALACDLRVAAPSARIGMPILRLGILCSPGFALRLTTLVGASRAKELLYTGRLLPAGQAADYGLLTEVAPEDGLDDAVARLVATLLAQPRTALVAAKAATAAALASLRAQSDAPAWRFSDRVEFPARVRRFLARSGRDSTQTD